MSALSKYVSAPGEVLMELGRSSVRLGGVTEAQVAACAVPCLVLGQPTFVVHLADLATVAVRGQIQLTPISAQVLPLARRHAEAQGQAYIGCEHLRSALDEIRPVPQRA